jgi:membrane-bound serine protease (ClpP class)
VVGAIALVLAFIGFGSLPLNLAGVLLILLGFTLWVLESQITSHGLLTLGGAVAVALGGSALYTAPLTPTAAPVAVAPILIGVATGTLAVLMLLVSLAAIATRRMPAPLMRRSTTAPTGTEGIVHAPLTPLGTVQLNGEAWSARTTDGRSLPRSAPVRLVGWDGLTAVVEPAPDPESSSHPPAVPMSADRP